MSTTSKSEATEFVVDVCTFTILLAQLADYKLLIFFLIFPQKTDFGISCKLSLQEQFA